MNSRTICLLIATVILAGQASVFADLIDIAQVGRKVNAAEAAGGAPLNGDVYQFMVTTDADILSVNQVRIYDFLTGQPLTLYHHPLVGVQFPVGSEPIFPGLSADSFIVTPGPTLLLGADLPGDGQTTFGDLTNDGPVDHYIFAQLTVPVGTQLGFSGGISIASVDNPGEVFRKAFQFVPVPEPSSLLVAAAAIAGGTALSRRARRSECYFTK
jgi:hypothetical protein